MGTNIDELSIFGEYGAAENRLTVALLQILKVGDEPLIRYFGERVGFPLPRKEIEIYAQHKLGGCTPDGVLRADFRFTLLIESKAVRNAIDPEQCDELVKALATIDGPRAVLYVTPDAECPTRLKGVPVSWANWVTVTQLLREYLATPEATGAALLEFLVDQFETFADNIGVSGEVWRPDASRVLVVPARAALRTAREFGLYVCQNRRSFQPSSWIAFYSHGEIAAYARIGGAPEDDVMLESSPEFARLVDDYRAQDVDTTTPRRVLRLVDLTSIPPIKNDQVDSSGRPTAWVQGQRYTSIERLRRATKTSDL